MPEYPSRLVEESLWLLALCVLVNSLEHLFVLLVALASPAHLLVSGLAAILELLLLIDLFGPQMDFLQLQHIEDVKDWVHLLVRVHRYSLLETLRISFQLLLDIVSREIDHAQQPLLLLDTLLFVLKVFVFNLKEVM